MKKLGIFVVLVVLIMFLCVGSVFAAENYVQLRYEFGRTEDGESFHGTCNIFENNSLEGWTLGSRLITAENDFKLIEPYAVYRIGMGLGLGLVYSDPPGDDSAGLRLRYRFKVDDVASVYFIGTQYLGFNGADNVTDFWLSIKAVSEGPWYYSMEFRYWVVGQDVVNFHLRPAKLSYVFSNGLAPFVMLERHWVDGPKSDSAFAGIEIAF